MRILDTRNQYIAYGILVLALATGCIIGDDEDDALFNNENPSSENNGGEDNNGDSQGPDNNGGNDDTSGSFTATIESDDPELAGTITGLAFVQDRVHDVETIYLINEEGLENEHDWISIGQLDNDDLDSLGAHEIVAGSPETSGYGDDFLGYVSIGVGYNEIYTLFAKSGEIMITSSTEKTGATERQVMGNFTMEVEGCKAFRHNCDAASMDVTATISGEFVAGEREARFYSREIPEPYNQ